MKATFLALLAIVITGCAQPQPQQPSAPSQESAPAQAEGPAQLQVRVEPQHPRSGKEAKLIAELRDVNGNPISDAEVKTTLVMSMGSMGDMRDSSTLKWTGSRYEATIKPSMAGEWDVTVEAMKGGRVIATQKSTIKAQ